jgi:hypothetical protein
LRFNGADDVTCNICHIKSKKIFSATLISEVCLVEIHGD